MVKRRTLRFLVTYPSVSCTYSACMILFFGSFEGKLLQKCLFHAGWMCKRSSELGADGKIDARNKQGNRSVPRDFRTEPRSLKGLINRLINSLAVVTAEPAGQAGWRRS